MNRSVLRTVSVVFASTIVSAWPIGVGAQAAPSEVFTVEQLRTEYVHQGYATDNPIAWWTPNQVTSFRVSDATSGRLLMVLVYPDAAMAKAERAKAEATEAVDATSSGSGPHLVPGYGFSTWRQNVALVESTAAELGREYAAEQDREAQILVGGGGSIEPTPARPTYAVDLDFLSAFDPAVVNL